MFRLASVAESSALVPRRRLQLLYRPALFKTCKAIWLHVFVASLFWDVRAVISFAAFTPGAAFIPSAFPVCTEYTAELHTCKHVNCCSTHQSFRCAFSSSSLG